MVLDIAAHILPPRFFEQVVAAAPSGFYQEKRIRAVPALVDVESRLRTIESFSAWDYRQVLTPGAPPVERIAGPEASPAACRLLNDELRELVDRYPQHFPTALGSLPLNNLEASLREVDHLVEIGLAGCKICTNVNGLPLDHPSILPAIEAACQRGLTLFLHPVRGREMPDYPVEDRSKFEIWHVFGWPYETTVAMTRLVFAGLFQRCPGAKIITHHLGGMVPYFASRAQHAFSQLGARTPDENYEQLLRDLPEHPVDTLHRFYADTALYGGPEAIACGVAFFGVGHVLWGSDTPFDPEGGSMYIRLSLEALEQTGLSAPAKEAILAGNARTLLGLGDR